MHASASSNGTRGVPGTPDRLSVGWASGCISPGGWPTPTTASCTSPTTLLVTGPAWSCACRWPHPSTVPPRRQSATATRLHNWTVSPPPTPSHVTRTGGSHRLAVLAGAAFESSCSSSGAAPEQDKRVDRARASVAEQRADDCEGPFGVGGVVDQQDPAEGDRTGEGEGAADVAALVGAVGHLQLRRALPDPFQDRVERQAADLGDAFGQVLDELGMAAGGHEADPGRPL